MSIKISDFPSLLESSDLSLFDELTGIFSGVNKNLTIIGLVGLINKYANGFKFMPLSIEKEAEYFGGQYNRFVEYYPLTDTVRPYRGVYTMCRGSWYINVNSAFPIEADSKQLLKLHSDWNGDVTITKGDIRTHGPVGLPSTALDYAENLTALINDIYGPGFVATQIGTTVQVIEEGDPLITGSYFEGMHDDMVVTTDVPSDPTYPVNATPAFGVIVGYSAEFQIAFIDVTNVVHVKCAEVMSRGAMVLLNEQGECRLPTQADYALGNFLYTGVLQKDADGPGSYKHVVITNTYQ